MDGLRDRLERFFVRQATELARDAAYEEQERLAEVLAELEDRTAELEHARGRLYSFDRAPSDSDPRVQELTSRLVERDSAVALARQEAAAAERRAAELESALRARDADVERVEARVAEVEALLELAPIAPERLSELARLETTRGEVARASADLRRREQQLAELRAQVHEAELRLEAEAELQDRRSLQLDEREAAVAGKEARIGRYLAEVQASLGG
jgi:chromosome segregation ATPase